MRHLLSAADLSLAEATSILDVAEEMHAIQGRQIKKLPTLRGRTVINMFFEDSTRTRTSFEMAGKWMSADTINVTGKGSSTSKGESLRDTMLTLDAMGTDCFVIRHGSSGAVAQAAGWVKAHVVNAGDGTHEHPTQALLDAFAMRRHFRGLGDDDGFGNKTIAIVGDLLHSRVVRSNVLLHRTLGSRVILVAPPTLLPTGIGDWGCEVTSSLDDVIAEVDVAMMLRVQRERMQGGFFPNEREYTELFGLTPERLRRLKPSAAVCHPGPMNRGMEISSEAADAANSLILEQVTAGVSVRMSVLYHLLGGSPE
ncbi:MAG: aspartate carbamoyltransferase catalytic subunit [Micropruina sp.]|nr:aspartate carbamoyltransferase catalytic subunit [Micropruina sp.]